MSADLPTHDSARGRDDTPFYDPEFDEDGDLSATFDIPGFGPSRVHVLNPEEVVGLPSGRGTADPGSIYINGMPENGDPVPDRATTEREMAEG